MSSNQSLTPWSQKQATASDIIDLLASLIGLPSRNFRTDESLTTAETSYIEVLEGIDLDILGKVISKFKSGDYIKDHETVQFFPSPAEINIQCRRELSRLAADRARDRELRQAKTADHVTEKTPEAKARVAAMVERVALETEAENRRHKPDEKDMSPDACKARLEALAASNGQSVDWDKIPNAPPPSGFVKAKPNLNGA